MSLYALNRVALIPPLKQKAQDFVDHAKSFYNVTVKLLSLAAQLSDQSPSEEGKTEAESEYDAVMKKVCEECFIFDTSCSGS